MKLFDWFKKLFTSGGDSDDSNTVDLSKAAVVKVYVDKVTGKTYKTAGALKAAQTRRKNKAKKTKKTKKAKK